MSATKGSPSTAEPTSAHQSNQERALVVSPAPDLLLVVFIHGFKGTDSTFGEFPIRLRTVLTESIANVYVECTVFPAYETKGELNEAVEHFADWLTELVVKKEVANGGGGGAGKAKVVLCGHSMGGLLAADSLVAFAKSRPDAYAPIWPHIIACIAYDTPYLGIHPYVIKNSASRAFKYANAASTIASDVFSAFNKKNAGPSTTTTTTAPPLPITGSESVEGVGWSKWLPAAYAVGGALVAGAAAGTAYYKRQEIGSGWSWATDHMKYVGNLWNEKSLKQRLEKLASIEKDLAVSFRVLYTYLPASPPSQIFSRTFIVLPDDSSPQAGYFKQVKNTIASDEIQAHTSMFEARSNDGYYELGLETMKIIREAMMHKRGFIKDPDASAADDRLKASAFALDPKEGATQGQGNKVDYTPASIA